MGQVGLNAVGDDVAQEPELALRDLAQHARDVLTTFPTAGWRKPGTIANWLGLGSDWKEPRDLRQYPREAANVRRGRMQLDDWWVVLSWLLGVLTYLACLVAMFQLNRFLNSDTELMFPDSMLRVVQVLGCYSVLPCVGLITMCTYFDLRALRRLLYSELAANDIVPHLSAVEQFSAGIIAATPWPFRRWYMKYDLHGFSNSLNCMADNLDWYVCKNSRHIR